VRGGCGIGREARGDEDLGVGCQGEETDMGCLEALNIVLVSGRAWVVSWLGGLFEKVLEFIFHVCRMEEPHSGLVRYLGGLGNSIGPGH
jgi:hypothetical protein